MICAPSATPKPVIDRLHAELEAVAATPEVRVGIGTVGRLGPGAVYERRLPAVV